MANSEIKVCQNCKSQFAIEPEDFQFYQKIKVPPPTFCPECRAVRRIIFWNQFSLFRKKEAIEGKEIFSTYPESAPIKIYSHDYWWSDKWDPMQYGQEYDFSRPFFEQFRELMRVMPWPALSVRSMVNSDYCNQANDLKNCYLCFDGDHAEDCLYCTAFDNSKNCMDIYHASKCELCYDGFAIGRCYQTFFSVESEDCRNSWFLKECSDCSDCFGCVELKHKQYYIFNQPYSKEDYFKKLAEFNLGSYESLTTIRQKVLEFWSKFPNKYTHSFLTENVEETDYMYNSKNVFHSFHGIELEKVRYSQSVFWDVSDSYDYTSWGDHSELIYESCICGDKCRNLKFSSDCWPACQDLEYCMDCHSSSDLFGCVGLTKKQYCIFNRQYDKTEYESMVAKIKEHMNDMPYTNARGIIYTYGEFFPAEFSPLAYNESAAQNFFPTEQTKANKLGYLWRELDQREFAVTISAAELPDHINEATPNILEEKIACSNCNRAYRIISNELEFYQRFELPLPRLCHSCRFQARVKFRNPVHWFPGKCQCVGKEPARTGYGNVALPHPSHVNTEPCLNTFQTTYAPNRPEIVYCEQCYNAEVA